MRTLLALALSAALPLAAAVDEDYQPRVSGKPADDKPVMLGVEMTPPSLSVLERENLKPDQGVLVQQVYPNTAASQAGVQPGDVIVSVNGRGISSMTDLRNEVGIGAVGEPVSVVVSRNGQLQKLDSEFKPWPEDIPRRPIDAAAEERFRGWQRERQERQEREAEQIERRIADANRRAQDAVAAQDGAGGDDRALPRDANGEAIPGAPIPGPDAPATWTIRRTMERVALGTPKAPTAAPASDVPAYRVRFPAPPSL